MLDSNIVPPTKISDCIFPQIANRFTLACAALHPHLRKAIHRFRKRHFASQGDVDPKMVMAAIDRG